MEVGEDLINMERSYMTPFANSSLLPMLLMSLLTQKHSPDTAKTFKPEYDYIIVGGGSAGSVVANRLSEKACVSILLLEAGAAPPVLTEVPSIERNFWNTEIDWAYKSVPQKNTGSGLQNRQYIYASGKAIGGSSVLNDVIYSRGNQKNYDDWAAGGADGWSYKDCLPYFKKLEDNRDPEYVANGYHGVGGQQTLHRPRYRSEFKGPLFQTADSFGYKVVDPNGRRQTGMYDLQGILRSGQLCSTGKGYLVPAENRTNLDILAKAMVRRIAIKNRIAEGVEFDYEGKTHFVIARKEVIVSAGTLNTPKLLMLSGIGPKEELRKHKIPVIADLPVGKNLQEHVGGTENFLFSKDIPEVNLKLGNPANIEQYISSRTGPIAGALMITAAAFFQVPHSPRPREDFPNFEMYFVEASTDLALGTFGLKPEVFSQVYGPYLKQSVYFCLTHLTQPRSRGTVTIASKDPYDDPLIDINAFAHPDDMQDVVDGLKECLRFGNSDIMKVVGSYRYNTTYPGCEEFVGDDDQYYRCQLKSVSNAFYHPVGTAKMGRLTDPTTVVDTKLRVKTIGRLRVVDASVMPIIPSGNTNIPTIMIAEKASDIIKETICCRGDKPALFRCDKDKPPEQDPNQQVTPWNKELLESQQSS